MIFSDLQIRNSKLQISASHSDLSHEAALLSPVICNQNNIDESEYWL